MKFYLLLAFIQLIVFKTVSISEIAEEIIFSIKNNDVDGVAKHFNSTIKLKLIDKEDVYSKEQARSILKDFFNKNKVKYFSTTHSNTQKNGQEFFIGILITENGKFKLSFLIKKANDKLMISQFRIDNEKN